MHAVVINNFLSFKTISSNLQSLYKTFFSAETDFVNARQL